ncbi:hypothetical protein ABCW43_02265 [Neorhizobium sp. IRAMC:178]|uniref:hypothetical protein n=1 Tax=Neorhizobium tunisiense TaxID=3144793 RepID=UPI0031F6AF71
MVALSALLIAQITDPIRIAGVLLGMWFVWSSYEGKRRLLPLVVALVVVAVLSALMLSQMRELRLPFSYHAFTTATGFVANCIIAGAAYGITRLFKSKSKVATRR